MVEHLPKFVIIPRPKEQGERLAREIKGRNLPVHPVLCPMLDIQPVDFEVPDPAAYDVLVFTSAHAVSAYAGNVRICSQRVYTVGSATAERALQKGFADVRTPTGKAADVPDFIEQHEQKNVRILYLHGRDISYPLEDAMRERGFSMDSAVVYEALKSSTIGKDCIRAMRSGEKGIVMLFSKRTAEAFVDAVCAEKLEKALGHIKVLCISDSVVKYVQAYSWDGVYVSENPDAPSMLDLLGRICHGHFENQQQESYRV